jgi:ABC-type sugar transport system ATPase subunit
VQRVDVLATPDELYSKVKSIFIQRLVNKSDTIIVKKLYWQTNKHFQIATIIQAPNQPKKMKQLQVTWDAGE